MGTLEETSKHTERKKALHRQSVQVPQASDSQCGLHGKIIRVCRPLKCCSSRVSFSAVQWNSFVSEVGKLDKEQIKEILEKQLQLLSEKSQQAKNTPHELAELSLAMDKITQCLFFTL